MAKVRRKRKVAIKVTSSRDPEPKRFWMIIEQGLIVDRDSFEWAVHHLSKRYPGACFHYFACDEMRPRGLKRFEKGGRFLGTGAVKKARRYLNNQL